jgi:protein gp37
MGENSKISWTDHTFNPWWGCAKVSPGCANCYAETLSNRFGSLWGKDAPRRFFDTKHWDEPLKWNSKAAAAGRNAKVFCGSMCDIFEDRPDLTEHRTRLFDLIMQTQHLTWLLLTKRPENLARLLPQEWNQKNVWLGVTAENQTAADKRIPLLLQAPAAVRFVSCEPLLGPVDLGIGVCQECGGCGETAGHYSQDDGMDTCGSCGGSGRAENKIDWVIAGGESGQKARPMHPDWSLSLRDQCQAAGVSFFFKQWGEWAQVEEFTGSNGNVFSDQLKQIEFGGEGNSLHMQRIGKAAAGELLDGVEWKQFPAPLKD